MSKLSEVERDGEAAARQIHALKNTIGRLNLVGVFFSFLFFCSLLCCIVYGCLKNVMSQLLIHQNHKEKWKDLACLRCLLDLFRNWIFVHLLTFCTGGAEYCSAAAFSSVR